MKNLTNYPTLGKVNNTITGELTYSLYLSGIAYESWFDKSGLPIDPLPLAGMTFNFSTSLAENFGYDEESSRQIVLKWDDQKTLFYKGIMIVGDEVMYVDTTIMKKKPYSQYGKIAIPVVDIDGNTVIERGVNGTKAIQHKAHSYCRTAINFTNNTLDISYNDNAELSESKPFSPVVSSGTIGIDINAIEWGNKEISGEKNIYKIYEINNRIPVYCFVGTRAEKVCEFVAFVSSFNIMPTREKIEIRIQDKTSLYWSEELNKSYQFRETNIKDVISIIFDYEEDMIKYPNEFYTDEHFMKVSNLNTNSYKSYRDIMQDIAKEMLVRISFNANEEIIIQSEVVMTNNTKNPGMVDRMLEDKSSYLSLTDVDNIFNIERSTSSGILYNKIDNEFKEYKTFFDGEFFELSYDSPEAVYPVSGMMNMKTLSQYLIDNNQTHRRYIYDTDNSKLYIACYEYINAGTQVPGLKHVLVNNKETCTIEEARKFRTPIKYKYSQKVENLRILDRTIDKQELRFNTIVVKLPKEQAEMLDPYGKDNGEYVVFFDGVNDFHGRVVDIKVVDSDYYDITIVFGYDKDYDYNFKGKTDFLTKYREGDILINYENAHNFVMYLVRKELPYVWEYQRGDKVSNVKVPIFGNDTFEVWANFGGVDTDDGKFSKMVDGIEYLYDNIYHSTSKNEYTQFSPVYMRSMMVGEYVSEKDGINSMYITDFSNDNLVMQILRSKPTDDLPKNMLVTGMSNKNNNSSDMFIRITTKLFGSTVKLKAPLEIDGTIFKAGTRFVTVDHLSSESIGAGVKESDLFEFYIVKANSKVVKIPKDYAETVAPLDKANNEVLNAFGKVILVNQDNYNKVNSGDIIIISEPTSEELKDPTIMMLYQKYKDSRWMVVSKSGDNNEFALYLDYEFPEKMKFEIIGGYIYGNPRLSGYCLLQQLSIKGNPILEYSQRYYYENAESVAKYGDKAYSGLTGKFMSQISDVNSSVSYIVNGFAGLTDKNQKMLIPITTSHIVGMEMLDTVRVIDRVYGTYDKLGVLVGKDFSVGSSGIKYNLRVFTIDSYEDDARGAIGSISEYRPIEFPTFGYKDGDGGWESSGNQMTKNDDRLGEIKFKKIDQSLFTLTVAANYYEGKQLSLKLTSPSQEEMSDKDFAEIFKAGSDLIVEDHGVKHLITITTLDRATGIVVGDLKLRNLFEKNIDAEVTFAAGTMLNMYQTITVMDEMSSIIDRVEIVEKENDENFGDGGILGDDKPNKPLNFRLEPAVNGFIVKLNHPDSKNIKGYQIYYRMIGKIVEDENGNTVVVEPEDNLERTMFTSATVTFVSAVGKRKYEVYLKSLSHKGQYSDATIILTVDTKVLGFEDIYYPPGQSPDELDEATKDLANHLSNQLDILSKADEYLRGQYGSITEDLEKNYYTKVDTDEQFTIGFGKVQETVLDQSKVYTDTQFGVVDGKIDMSVEKLEEKYTELGGEIDWAKSQINMTQEQIDMYVKETNIKIDGMDQEIKDNYSEFVQTSKEISTTVGEIETRVNEAEITIEKEVTEINQRADGIELIAQRSEAKVDKQALVGSNYLYNSGEFTVGITKIEQVEIPDPDNKDQTITVDTEVVKKDPNGTHPLYWKNINPQTEYPCSVIEIEDGTKIISIPHTEGIEHQGIHVPGGTTYYCSATMQMEREFQTNAFEPVSLWVSSVLDPEVEGVYGKDYTLEVLGTHIVKKPDPNNPDKEITEEVPDEFPTLNSNEWKTVKIKVIIKGSTANKVRIIPKIKTNIPEARKMTLKNIQFRMGETYKTWEPSIEQSLNPTNLVSLINITPDEIKLDSKLIKIGGGIIVEGENVAVNNLSAARLQLGDNFYYTEGDRDENGELIPDTERLIITKLNLGQVGALNPDLPSESVTIEQYIKNLDNEAKKEMVGEIKKAEEKLEGHIQAVKVDADKSLETLKGMASDSKLTGQEKPSIIQEYKTLYNRVKMLETDIRSKGQNEPLFLTINLAPLQDLIWDDTKADSLNHYLTYTILLYQKNADDTYTDSTIDPTEFNEKWKIAYDAEQTVLNKVSDVLNELSEKAQNSANAAKLAADKAQNDADAANAAAIKSEIAAKESMQNVSKSADDGFLSSAEKKTMLKDWVELKESSESIKRQVENSTYASLVTNLHLIVDKITGVGNDSLFSYLSSNETRFFDIEATEKKEITLNNGKKEMITVLGTTLFSDSSEQGSVKFQRKWHEAYDAKQQILNKISDLTDKRLVEAQEQALLSIYGQYDPFFRQHENTGADSTTLWMYSFRGDGDGKSLLDNQKIINYTGLYMLNGGEYSSNPVLRVNGVNTVYWKNPVKVENNIHYKLLSRIKSGNVLLNTTIGIVCLDGNYKEIGRVSPPKYLTTSSWADVSMYITSIADSQRTEYRFPAGTMYVRPFLSVPEASRDNFTLFQSLEFVNAQDEVNKEVIEDIFSDNKITPDEKKELNRTLTEIKEDKKKIDILVQFPTFKEKIDATSPNENESKLLTKYHNAYNSAIKMLESILDSNLPDVIEFSVEDRNRLNSITANYYSAKSALQARMAVVAKEVAEENAGEYTDQREAFIKNLIDQGYVVLTDHTICLASFVIQSGGASDGQGRPIWTPDSDYTQISGGKIEYFRGTTAGKPALVSTISPFVRGEATMEYFPSDTVYPYHKDISFPYLKSSITTVLPSLKQFSVTRNVRGINVVAQQINTTHNTWRFSVQGTEEEYSIEQGQPLSSWSTVVRDTYGVDLRALTVQFPALAITDTTWQHDYGKPPAGGGDGWRKPAVYEVYIYIQDSVSKKLMSKSEIEIEGTGNTTPENWNTGNQKIISKQIKIDVSGAILRTNTKDDKTITIELRAKPGIQFNRWNRNHYWAEWGYTDTNESSKMRHNRLTYNLPSNTISSAIFSGTYTKFDEKIVSTISGGAISFIAYEKASERNM